MPFFYQRQKVGQKCRVTWSEGAARFLGWAGDFAMLAVDSEGPLCASFPSCAIDRARTVHLSEAMENAEKNVSSIYVYIHFYNGRIRIVVLVASLEGLRQDKQDQPKRER